ncbi:MAG: tRNA pseudouridine(13) synthase TruD [Planctomycetota bacterium]
MTDPLDLDGGLPFAFRARPEDFIVEELASDVEAPDPSGTHVWFTVEKRDVSTPEAARRIARALGRAPAEVHFAGRKDAVAVTRQRMSIEHVDPDALLALDLAGIRIRDPLRCRKRIRLGQTGGNRFHLRLTELAEADHARLGSRLAELAEVGLPNAYGEQRFGADGAGIELARRLVGGDAIGYLAGMAERVRRNRRAAAHELVRRIRDGSSSERRRARELVPDLDEDLRAVAKELARRRSEDPASLVRAVPKRTRAFHLSILQASVYNRVLAERERQGTLRSVLLGDVVAREDGRHSVVTEERPAPAGAVPTGPICGGKAPLAEGEPGRIERAALVAEGLSIEDLVAPAGLTPRGARRPLVAPVTNARLDPWSEGTAWIVFDLPVGAYATVVLDLLGAARPDPGTVSEDVAG